MNFRYLSALLALSLAACSSMDELGVPPRMTPAQGGAAHAAMLGPDVVIPLEQGPAAAQASLWSGTGQSLLGDRRALERGDILTVVIEIDEQAEISNQSDRSRTGSENFGVPDFIGFPQRLDQRLPEGASASSLIGINSSSSSSGDGSVKRREKLTLRVAATVVEVLPSGVLSIVGNQEVRVNFELRELLVSGYVRPNDISRQNEITYDKIASARVSYGGRGQITDVQQPRMGQQVLDLILPY